MSGRHLELRALRGVWRRAGATRAEIRSYQDRCLRRLVAHVYERVPFYRGRFQQADLTPGDIRGREDLRSLPILTRQELQALPVEEIVAAGLRAERLTVHSTSGSSGQRIRIRRTWLENKLLRLYAGRAMRYFGARRGDRRASIGLPRERGPVERVLRPIFGPIGGYRASTVDLFSEPEEMISSLRRLRPKIVAGYPGVLARLAGRLTEADRSRIRPRFVLSGAEVLTPMVRREIARGFAAPVYEWYASWEFGVLAWECKETGLYHVCDDSVILEVLDDGRPVGPGGRGEVVATALHSYAMPFIRYRLGDVVTRGDERCPCGQPFSTISAIQGRMLDYFRLPDGRMLHPYQITMSSTNSLEWCVQCQIIQEREDRVRVLLVPSRPPTAEEMGGLTESLGACLGPLVEVKVELVEEIPADDTGKFRPYRSLVTGSATR